MPSLDFPSNPTDQQTYTLNGITYQYNAAIGAWLTVVVGSQPVTLANNTQVLYSNNGLITGSNGLVFNNSANTLYANTVIVAGSAIPSGNIFNLAYATANAGFVTANAALANTSGTFAGNLSITGNVGIGSVVGSNRLLISTPLTGTTIRSNPALRIQSEATGRDICVQFSDNVTNSAEVGMLAGNVYFTSNGTERMRIDANGNIGIGVASPSYGFHHRVFGNAEIATQYGTGTTTTILGAYASEGSVRTGNNPITLWTNGVERMRIDASGRVTIPNQPFFMGQPTTDYSGGSMPTRVMDVTALYNNGGHFNNSTDRFTCPVTGWYRSTWGGLQLPSTVTSLMVNGSRTYNGNHFPAASPNYITMTQTALRYLNAGDYLEIEQWNGGGYYNAWWLWTVELVG